MFESLSDKLEGAFKTLKGQGSITEVNVATTLKEIRRALVDADVNYKIAKEFTGRVKEEALGQDVLSAVQPGQMMIKIVNDELTELMGGEVAPFKLKNTPSVVLISGLQGSGKTTFTAKLAKFMIEKRQKKTLLIAGDVYRPAAIEQLRVLGKQINTEVFANENLKDPVQIALDGIAHAKQNKFDLVIIDTAGRLAVDEVMMNEISRVKEATDPDETLFVVDSMTGQDAVNTAKTFNERLDFDGVVLTKLDGDTRGGAALTIKYVVDKPIKFISYGEKMDTIDFFHPDRMASRILGMGDVISFVERAQAQFDEDQAEKLQKKINRNKFDFNDFLSQLAQLRKMGSFKELLGMIPGAGKMLKDVDIDESQFKRIEAIIYSMTKEERESPRLLGSSTRRRRIAKGSGNSIQEVNQFIKQFDEMRKMLKTMSKFAKSGRQPKGLPFQK